MSNAFTQLSPKASINIEDLRRVRRKLTIEANRLKKKYGGIPWDLARMGQLYARSIAPYYSGTLFKAISHKTLTGGKAEVYVDTKILRTNLNNRGDFFNYARWMHDSNGMRLGRKWITSGDPQFMWTTRSFLMRKLKQKIQTNLGG